MPERFQEPRKLIFWTRTFWAFRLILIIEQRKSYKKTSSTILERVFLCPGNLKNHVFSHTNERPYRCEICGRGFNQMSNLVVHKFKSHGHTGHVPRSPSSSDAKPPKKSKLNGTKSSKSAGTRRSNAAAAVTTASVDTVDDESASKVKLKT